MKKDRPRSQTITAVYKVYAKYHSEKWILANVLVWFKTRMQNMIIK